MEICLLCHFWGSDGMDDAGGSVDGEERADV